MYLYRWRNSRFMLSIIIYYIYILCYKHVYTTKVILKVIVLNIIKMYYFTNNIFLVKMIYKNHYIIHFWNFVLLNLI